MRYGQIAEGEWVKLGLGFIKKQPGNSRLFFLSIVNPF